MPDGGTDGRFAARGAVVRDWRSAFGGQSMQLAAQAVSFLLLARALGARSFGVWVALTAFSGLTVHIAGLGFGNLLVRNTARDRRTFAESWGNAVAVTVLSGTVLTATAAMTAAAIMPAGVPPAVAATVLAADLIFFRLVTLVATACQALGRFGAMSRVIALTQWTRVLAVIVWAAVPPGNSLAAWTVAYAATSVATCAAAGWWAWLRFDRPVLSMARVRAEWRDGGYFVLSPYTQVLNNDADKIILGHVTGLETVGVYGAAYRVLTAALVPTQSLLTAAYPRFFERGDRGLSSSADLARSLAPVALACSIGAAAVLLAGARLLPVVLGSGYGETARVVAWLCPLPALKTIQFLYADALTGADRQRQRTAQQAAAAALNIVLNLLLDPWLAWRGAAIATLAADGALATALWRGTARSDPA